MAEMIDKPTALPAEKCPDCGAALPPNRFKCNDCEAMDIAEARIWGYWLPEPDDHRKPIRKP
jgi:uncharacterized OB-fold protein